MAGLDVIVNKFVALWSVPVFRQNFHWLFLCISVVGSILKETELVPKTYFSHSKNVLNVYFVKISWGWTLLLLTPFIFLSNSQINKSVTFLCRRLSSLAVATAIWYTCTETFFYIEDATGSCFESASMDVIIQEFTSKATCRKAGFHWQGYDISGHSFILAYSALIIAEEMTPYLKRAGAPPNPILDLLYLALNCIVIIWIWMFGCTSVYFHDISHKLLGTCCGILGWYLTYGVWYLKPLSPGLPPQPKELKQRA